MRHACVCSRHHAGAQPAILTKVRKNCRDIVPWRRDPFSINIIAFIDLIEANTLALGVLLCAAGEALARGRGIPTTYAEQHRRSGK